MHLGGIPNSHLHVTIIESLYVLAVSLKTTWESTSKLFISTFMNFRFILEDCLNWSKYFKTAQLFWMRWALRNDAYGPSMWDASELFMELVTNQVAREENLILKTALKAKHMIPPNSFLLWVTHGTWWLTGKTILQMFFESGFQKTHI